LKEGDERNKLRWIVQSRPTAIAAAAWRQADRVIVTACRLSLPKALVTCFSYYFI